MARPDVDAEGALKSSGPMCFDESPGSAGQGRSESRRVSCACRVAGEWHAVVVKAAVGQLLLSCERVYLGVGVSHMHNF